MTDQDTNSDGTTRRSVLKGGATLIPLSHNGDSGGLFGIFSSDDGDGGHLIGIGIQKEGETVIKKPKTLNFDDAAFEVIQPNDYDKEARIELDGALVVEDEDISPASVDTGLVSTDDLDIAGSDLAASGDYVERRSFAAFSRSFSTTSTSYTSDVTQFDVQLTWDHVIPANGQGAFNYECQVSPGTDETVDIRLQNTVDVETMGEITGITTAGSLTIGPSNYTPTTRTGVIKLEAQIRNSNGANSSTLRRPQGGVGVQV